LQVTEFFDGELHVLGVQGNTEIWTTNQHNEAAAATLAEMWIAVLLQSSAAQPGTFEMLCGQSWSWRVLLAHCICAACSSTCCAHVC
jgi:hypothetical protein